MAKLPVRHLQGKKMTERKILIDDLEVNYKTAGEGKPLLILHGWGGSSNSWLEVQKILASKGYKVITPDLPGFGKTPSPRKAWEIGDYTDFFSQFIEKLGLEKIILLGHSFGGRISIRFTSLHPERLEFLILCGSAGVKLPATLTQKIIYIIARIGNFIFTPKLLRRFKDWVRNNFYMLIRQRDYRKVKGTMRETFKKVIPQDLSSDLPKIKTKTLIIWGARDKTVPIKAAYIIKEKIPNSNLEIMPRIAHTPHLEAPEKLSEVILNFIK